MKAKWDVYVMYAIYVEKWGKNEKNIVWFKVNVAHR